MVGRGFAGESPQELNRLARQLLISALHARLTAYELIAMHPGGIAALTPNRLRIGRKN
jgi:hypothetical protein